jgi:hypothetical protein
MEFTRNPSLSHKGLEVWDYVCPPCALLGAPPWTETMEHEVCMLLTHNLKEWHYRDQLAAAVAEIMRLREEISKR